MKLFSLLFLFVSFTLFSQERNAEVRKLNEVVSCMDAFSRMEQTAYFDVVQLAKGIHQGCEKVNPNYFYLVGGRTNSNMSDWIPYLKSREKVAGISFGKGISEEFPVRLNTYIESTNNFFSKHTELTAYIANKDYDSDSSFEKGKQILEEMSVLFEICHTNNAALESVLRNVFETRFPPNKSHPLLLPAEKELRETVDLLNKWQDKLYSGDQSFTVNYDKELHAKNETGLSRDSVYLYRTKGYGNKNSGWWAHTRYSTFYTSMQSNLYWYTSAKIHPEAFLNSNDLYYNGFINGYNNVVEDYNDFVALMDGKTFRTESECCLSPQDIDLDENVMLHFPRLLYRYSYVDPCIKQIKDPVNQAVNATDSERLKNAVPHHLVYLLDVSGSMSENGKIETLRESTKYLVNLQGEKHRMSVVLFADKESVLLENVACSEQKMIFSKIDGLKANGYTLVKAGVESAAKIAESTIISDGKTKIVLITDGVFELDKQTKKRITDLHAKGISFSVIFLGNKTGSKYEKQLIQLCEKTNGRFHHVTPADFKEALLEEASE